MKKTTRKLSLTTRVTLPSIILLYLGIFSIITIVYFNFTSAVTNIIHETAKSSTLQLVNDARTDLEPAFVDASSLATLFRTKIELGRADRADLVLSLESLLDDKTEINTAYAYFEAGSYDTEASVFAPYLDKISNVISTTYMAYENIDVALIERAKMSKRVFLTEPAIHHGVYVSAFIAPIWVENTFRGFIAVEYDFSYLNKSLRSHTNPSFPNAINTLVSSNGIYVGHSQESALGQSAFFIESKEYESILKTAQVNRSTAYGNLNSAVGMNAKCFVVAEPLNLNIENALPWLIMTVIPDSDIQQPINSTLITITIILLIIGCVSPTSLYITCTVISRKLVNETENLFNATRAILSASSQISGSSEILADGGVQQAASVEQTSATMSQTAAMIQATSTSTQQAHELANEANHATTDGLERVRDLVITMQGLEKSSEEISKIIKIIDDIAFQTNVLAVNAAVEAARTGDIGRGFAVVAEEVRNLAQRSAEAANSTAEIIQNNLLLSKRCVENSTEVGFALKTISQHNNEINILVNMINDASQEQATAINQINYALAQIENVTQSNAAISEENSASATELESQAHDLGNIVDKLSLIVRGSTRALQSLFKDEDNRPPQLPQNSNRSKRPQGRPKGMLIGPNDRI